MREIYLDNKDKVRLQCFYKHNAKAFWDLVHNSSQFWVLLWTADFCGLKLSKQGKTIMTWLQTETVGEKNQTKPKRNQTTQKNQQRNPEFWVFMALIYWGSYTGFTASIFLSQYRIPDVCDPMLLTTLSVPPFSFY